VLAIFGTPGTGWQAIARNVGLVPADVSSIADTIFYADTLDLNCDGLSDFIGQIIPSSGTVGPTLVAFVQEDGRYRQVLLSRSPVDGSEALAIAADLTGLGRRDIVTLGSDEGGYIPRVFVWREGEYTPLGVPLEYHLRLETEWNSECLRKLNPGLVDGGRITLLRETISPTALKGHGAECDLPTDTLHIVGDSLVRAGR
jgi:hypothetical protein